MFGSVMYGAVTALGWGVADFIARFTGQRLGYQSALLGMLGVSAVALTPVVFLADIPLVVDTSGWWLLLACGLGIMLGTMLLYRGLVQGPITVVAPIVGGFPAFNLLFALFLGVRPTTEQWFAMVLVMSGVIIVARCARVSAVEGGRSKNPTPVSTIAIALASSLTFALTVLAAQGAMEVYGELQTVWLARWIGFFAIAAVFGCKWEPPCLPPRWWPVLTLQGLLDAAAYMALLLGSPGLGGHIAVVIGSSFSVVTVMLARMILREAMTWPQWGGVCAIVAGVCLLSLYA